MKVTDLDFHLPGYLVADRPAVPRDNCRLLVLGRDGSIEHRKFSYLSEYLYGGDLLLLNNTKVFPARLTAAKQTGGKLDILFVRETGRDVWEVLTRENYSGKVFLSGMPLGDMLQGKSLMLAFGIDIRKILWEIGSMPLPPYIKRKADLADMTSYQTVYAEKEGSIAAPTAGLHFTDQLLSKLENRGVIVRFLTLHVGSGTFRSIKVENPEEHTMEEERFEAGRDLLDTIRKVKQSGRRLIAVGTTTTRAIEGIFSRRYRTIDSSENGYIKGKTDIFIFPGYQFRVVDSLVTNFHLPGSTPLLLTAALSGREKLLTAYRCAISMKYRFFSYGDAMLVL